MSGRRWLAIIALASASVTLACGDYTSPTSPLQPQASKVVPVRASLSRYILISGVWTCVDECEGRSRDGDDDQKLESLQTGLPGGLPIGPLSFGNLP